MPDPVPKHESMNNRIVGYGEESTENLLANPKNWRVHSRKQQDALKGVLDSVGWVQPIIVNRKSGFVVDGHLRVMLAMRNNQSTIPVVYVDLTDAEEDMILATYDPIGEMSKQDQVKRKELFESIAEARREAAGFLYHKKKMTRLQAAKAADASQLRTAPVYEITFAFNDKERRNILKALTRLKKRFLVKSNVEAFMAACRRYKEVHLVG